MTCEIIMMCWLYWLHYTLYHVSILYSYTHILTDFAQLKTHYHAILQLMPDNYEQSVGKLQNYISDDQICMILSSSNSTTANKIILDCLIERMNCRGDLLDLCDHATGDY